MLTFKRHNFFYKIKFDHRGKLGHKMSNYLKIHFFIDNFSVLNLILSKLYMNANKNATFVLVL